MVKKLTAKQPQTRKINTTYAFIDSQNLNLAIRDQGWKLDFAKFGKYLKEKYMFEKAFIFIGFIPSNQHLYDYLLKSNYGSKLVSLRHCFN